MTNHIEPTANTAFIIPLNAPLPSVLADFELPTGSLMARLAPLGDENPTSTVLVSVDGADLYALERIWRSLAIRPSICVLEGLPGARYDPLFERACRVLGLQSVDWYSLEQWFTESAVEANRLRSTRPDLSPDKGLSDAPTTVNRQINSAPLVPGVRAAQRQAPDEDGELSMEE